jgi:hypothetical protein
MIDPAEALLRQPSLRVADLSGTDIPLEPGIYAWYRHGRLLYVGESRRGLRSRLWGNHIRGNARGSTLRNKLAKSFSFPAIRARTYGPHAEQAISSKLRECQVRFLAVPPEAIADAQSHLIAELDPPLNDHPGHVPRWRIEEVREILAIDPPPGIAPTPGTGEAMPATLVHSLRITRADIRAGRIRLPRPAKRFFPKEHAQVRVALRGLQLEARYDPRTDPDRERSAVLLVGKANLERIVQADEVLSVSPAEGIVRLD